MRKVPAGAGQASTYLVVHFAGRLLYPLVMHICIDIQAAIAQRAGVGRYTHQLVEHLAASRSEDDRLRAFYFDFRRNGSPLREGVVEERAVCWLPGALAQQAWKRLQTPPFQWFSGSADLYHFTNYVIPPIAAKVKTVVTIHDAGYLVVPETLEPKNLSYLRKQIGRTVRRADMILTPSETIAAELREVYDLPAERVQATLLGLSDEFSTPSPDRIAAARTAHKLDRPYLLHVGTIEPRKNHAFLLQVFEALEAFDGDLVLVGMRGWKNEAFEAQLAASPVRDRVRFPDYVSDDHLPALYAGASAFVFPSLYEGFGLPPLEAMRCGCPVLSSAGGSLREVVPPGGMVLDTFDVEAWVDALHLLLGDETRRQAQIEAGKAHAASFTWERTARKTWDMYRQVAHS